MSDSKLYFNGEEIPTKGDLIFGIGENILITNNQEKGPEAEFLLVDGPSKASSDLLASLDPAKPCKRCNQPFEYSEVLDFCEECLEKEIEESIARLKNFAIWMSLQMEKLEELRNGK